MTDHAFDFEAVMIAIRRLHGEDEVNRLTGIIKSARRFRGFAPELSVDDCVHDALVMSTPQRERV